MGERAPQEPSLSIGAGYVLPHLQQFQNVVQKRHFGSAMRKGMEEQTTVRSIDWPVQLTFFCRVEMLRLKRSWSWAPILEASL